MRSDAMIKGRRDAFNEQMREKFLSKVDSKSFHNGVKSLLSTEECKKWDPRSLFPGKKDEEVANILVGYFNNIRQEDRPVLPEDIPRKYDRQFPELDPGIFYCRSTEEGKKTTSRVDGDIFASLYSAFPDRLATLVKNTFNAIIRERRWASLWRTEHVTVLPKVPSPVEPGVC